MVARLGRDFRQGDLAEHLGILLLKSVAAVADVPRQEDVGLDAICSLLRLDADGNLYSEDGFVVQIKASSVTKIAFQDHSLKWLLGQLQPMYIASVSLKESSIALYSTIIIHQAALAFEETGFLAVLGNLPGEERGGWLSNESGCRVYLGPPVARWTVADMENKDVLSNVYETLKSHCSFASAELHLISLGQWSSGTGWVTNLPGSCKGASIALKGHPDNIVPLLLACGPPLRALALTAAAHNDEEVSKLVVPAVALMQTARALGVDIDPDNIFSRVSIARFGAQPPNPGEAES